jgi:formylglycine-generating enzyme required for sulfatase activity
MMGLVLTAMASFAAAAAPLEFKDCANCPPMVVVPAGQFIMGSPAVEPDRDADEGPQRPVTIAAAFAIGKYEVTRGQYAEFVAETNRQDQAGCMVWTGEKLESVAGRSWRSPLIDQTDDHPVVCVSWRDAAAYAAWLSKKTGKPYRLPAETEWEYAVRGGAEGAYAFPGGEAGACAYANVGDMSAAKSNGKWRTAPCDDGVGFGTARVGSYRANGFGLHDTIGNVWEWMADCYHPTFEGAPSDGSAWGVGGDCGTVLDRGGGFSSLIPGNLRIANRSRAPSPDNPAYSLGFRIARSLNNGKP